MIEADDKRRWREAVRILEAVSVLHANGLQRIRIMPYLHPLAWRVAIGPTRIFDPGGIFVPDKHFARCATHSSASGAACFGWLDAVHDDAIAVADKLASRFPDIAQEGSGQDAPYSIWLRGLLGALLDEQTLPILFSDNRPFDPALPFLALMCVRSGKLRATYPAPPAAPLLDPDGARFPEINEDDDLRPA